MTLLHCIGEVRGKLTRVKSTLLLKLACLHEIPPLVLTCTRLPVRIAAMILVIYDGGDAFPASCLSDVAIMRADVLDETSFLSGGPLGIPLWCSLLLVAYHDIDAS